MAKRAGYQVIGLPNYVVWHIDTQEKEGNMIDPNVNTKKPVDSLVEPKKEPGGQT